MKLSHPSDRKQIARHVTALPVRAQDHRRFRISGS
jgi:hypothetical protein